MSFGTSFGSSSFGGGGGGGGFGATNNGGSGGFSFGGGNTGGNTGGGGFGQPAANGGGFMQQSQPQQMQGNQGGNAAGGLPFGMVMSENNDYEIPRDQNSAQDSFSSVAWSPVQGSNLLIAGSWDGKVRCYEVQDNGHQFQAQLQASVDCGAPVLDVCFKHDGTGCFAATAGNMAKMWTFSSSGQQTAQDVGKHDAPIRAIRWIQESNLLATAGWDNKLRYWDLRSSQPVLDLQLPGRCDCMDIKFPYAVVATGGTEDERQVIIYNLQNNPRVPERVMNEQPPSNTTLANNRPAQTKPLKRQYRTVAIFPNGGGFAVASIEGRCSIQYFQSHRLKDNFAFKCHRDKNNKQIFSVNEIAIHQQFGTFATVGNDGMWNFWDKDSKQRLKAGQPVKMQTGDVVPIVACAFNTAGNLFAYAVSYDWSKGAQGCPNANVSTIMIHRTTENEIKPKTR
ncbi:mRNA export factor [Hondaea fermentalgiana]|uniref:mRNA export factor n=1 Tax=Hondaea fermentalgiana TaxID=2315210 RepID=A0A2R5G986_9STRA|nr:mRNA export factor [Hondaea fermentalgiana]|eukprot:GBG24631.1 mRNA export factor [Hondaea fermentalgiana]